MKLCLLVSRRCNLRCAFCRVEFTGRDMDWETASPAVESYLRWGSRDGRGCVKFFGGEPLLNFDLISRLVEVGRTRWKGAGLRFELATNGSFLDGERLRYFGSRPEVEVTISGPAPDAGFLPGACFTVVIEPDSRPEQVLKRVGCLLSAGYRRFNFLPAYYVVWTPSEVGNLRRSFMALRRLFEGLRERGQDVQIKNLEVESAVPLYNDALTVDVDGTFYASNMVQCQGMEPYRERLRVGHVRDVSEKTYRSSVRPGVLRSALKRWAGRDRWDSTQIVDRALTEFVVEMRRPRREAFFAGAVTVRA